MIKFSAFVVVMLASSTVTAERRYYKLQTGYRERKCHFNGIMPAEPHGDLCRTLRRQVQADLGLSVINAAYEEPVGDHWALQIEGGIFGTYFLPWFDLGDEVRGWGGGTRLTWFSRDTGRGPYVAPYLRVNRIKGEDAAGVDHTGVGLTAGVFVGWAFGITDRLDLRIGVGAQYIYLNAPPLGASTPFVALDLVVGYRL